MGEDNPEQVSSAEKTAGTETTLRSFSPDDVKDMVEEHESDSGGEDNPEQVSSAEKTAGTETAIRSFSPDDVKDMVEEHESADGGGGGGGGGTGGQSAEIELFSHNNFTASTTPQNITLDVDISTLEDNSLFEVFIEQGFVDASTDIDEFGQRAVAEATLKHIKELPAITNADFTATAVHNTLKMEVARLNTYDSTSDAGNATVVIGRISNTELRIAFSHAVIDGASIEIRAINYARLAEYIPRARTTQTATNHLLSPEPDVTVTQRRSRFPLFR